LVAILPDAALGCHDVHVLRKIDCVMVRVPVGKGAVVEDPYGNAICVLDQSKGPRPGL
jgi:hypothetical protein